MHVVFSKPCTTLTPPARQCDFDCIEDSGLPRIVLPNKNCRLAQLDVELLDRSEIFDVEPPVSVTEFLSSRQERNCGPPYQRGNRCGSQDHAIWAAGDHHNAALLYTYDSAVSKPTSLRQPASSARWVRTGRPHRRRGDFAPYGVGRARSESYA